MRLPPLPGPNTALFSDDRTHRLWLTRHRPAELLDVVLGRALFVMLNPSTADEFANDMTVTKCLGFARQLGASEIGIVNLFTACATDPRGLQHLAEPNHPDADVVIERAFEWLRERHPTGELRNCIFAYGAPPWAGLRLDNKSTSGHMLRAQAQRVAFVREAAQRVQARPMALGLTADAWPRHPSRFGYSDGLNDFLQPVPSRHFASLGLEAS